MLIYGIDELKGWNDDLSMVEGQSGKSGTEDSRIGRGQE